MRLFFISRRGVGAGEQQPPRGSHLPYLVAQALHPAEGRLAGEGEDEGGIGPAGQRFTPGRVSVSVGHYGQQRPRVVGGGFEGVWRYLAAHTLRLKQEVGSVKALPRLRPRLAAPARKAAVVILHAFYLVDTACQRHLVREGRVRVFDELRLYEQRPGGGYGLFKTAVGIGDEEVREGRERYLRHRREHHEAPRESRLLGASRQAEGFSLSRLDH
ncbi:hypothetical protein SDC9_116700 [bioreactor metagenome]|uniref:Uncharacterized protein n=1 Tax=bioreactor metagenome TaxID=1076179 RepID=A0A645BWU1_9ZZZZ